VSDALTEAAGRLRAARCPLIVVDAVDLAAAAQCVALARAAGARLDHAQPSSLAPMQEQGSHLTSHGEATLRADHVLLVGPFAKAGRDDEGLARLLRPGEGRAFTHIGPAGSLPPTNGLEIASFDVPERDLHAAIGCLSALAANQLVSPSAPASNWAADVVSAMRSAAYGVATFAVGQIDTHSQHALMRLVDTLAAQTRWAMLPLAVPDGQGELTRMCQALTGLPPPLVFSPKRPRHDPVLGGARGVAGRGEADVGVWICASRKPPPDWLLATCRELISITAEPGTSDTDVLHIEVGIPGVDHPAIVEPSELGTFVAMSPVRESARAAAASVLCAIVDQMTSASPGEKTA